LEKITGMERCLHESSPPLSYRDAEEEDKNYDKVRETKNVLTQHQHNYAVLKVAENVQPLVSTIYPPPTAAEPRLEAEDRVVIADAPPSPAQPEERPRSLPEHMAPLVDQVYRAILLENVLGRRSIATEAKAVSQAKLAVPPVSPTPPPVSAATPPVSAATLPVSPTTPPVPVAPPAAAQLEQKSSVTLTKPRQRARVPVHEEEEEEEKEAVSTSKKRGRLQQSDVSESNIIPDGVHRRRSARLRK
jgi:hypothetical protein